MIRNCLIALALLLAAGSATAGDLPDSPTGLWLMMDGKATPLTDVAPVDRTIVLDNLTRLMAYHDKSFIADLTGRRLDDKVAAGLRKKTLVRGPVRLLVDHRRLPRQRAILIPIATVPESIKLPFAEIKTGLYFDVVRIGRYAAQAYAYFEQIAPRRTEFVEMGGQTYERFQFFTDAPASFCLALVDRALPEHAKAKIKACFPIEVK